MRQIGVIACLATVLTSSAIDPTRSFDLAQGWNSIWLSVEPRDADDNPQQLATVFETTPEVTVVATLFKPVGTAEFFTDSDGTPFNQESWGVWRSSSALQENTLTTMPGQRGYVIYATAAVTVVITGAVWFQPPTWYPDSFNHVGFDLLGTPTFDELFATGGDRHPVNKIFRLAADGNWEGVQAGDAMGDGTAYMIFANGRSDFMGAVSVDVDRALDFGEGPGTTAVPGPGGVDILVSMRELTFSNPTAVEQTPRIRKEVSATNDDKLQIYHVVPDAIALESTIGFGRVGDMPVNVNPGASRTIALGAYRHSWHNHPLTREELYRIDLGTHYFWLPMTAERGDPTTYDGLWIGDAVIDTVSSITEDGAPRRATTSNAPVRVLILRDFTDVWLLKHVLLMQEKSADDDEAPPGVVLVVDEEKIPFFDGIEERRGKRVGQRLETVAYDMPRKIDAVTQKTIYDDEDNSVDDEASFADWLSVQTARPPDLVEDYHFKWQLSGDFGPGATLRTAAGSPLLLDPFHRGNPFRHAFHPRHGAGIAIERAITITFDTTQAAGQLQGDYEETLTGLTNTPLTVRGRITLQRVTTVRKVQ